MKRAVYHQRGPVPQDLIRVEPFEPGPLQPGQALVEVLAAPINPSDVLTLTGHYGILPPLPAVGGGEGVGRVVEVAGDVDAPARGTCVLLPLGCGSWATHVVADARTLVALPEGVDPVQLSMLSVNPPTASLLLSDFVALQPGEWVAQNAANSAVGLYVAQLARARGLRTVNLVRREGARAAVEAVGGEVVLVDGDDVAARVREACGGAPIRLGLDAVGGPATERLAGLLAPGATVVNYGALGNARCELSPQQLIFRDIRLHGFWLARWFRTADGAARQALFGELVRMIATGALRVPVHATYPLEEIRSAIAEAAAGGRDGKVVLLPNGRERLHA